MYRTNIVLIIDPSIMKLMLVNTSIMNITARYVSETKNECDAVGIISCSSLIFIFHTVNTYQILKIKLFITAKDIIEIQI